MKYIQIVPLNESFRWQSNLFEYSLKKVYGDKFKDYAIIPFLKRNQPTDLPTYEYPYETELDTMAIDPIYDIIGKEEAKYIPVNVYSGLRQVLQTLPDDEVVMCIDSDMPLLKPYTGRLPEYHEMLVDNIYEDWHMHLNGKNRNAVEPFLNHKDVNYMSGGSNFMGRVKTWKYIIDNIVESAVRIIDTFPQNNQFRWWANMLGANIACHNYRVPMNHIGGCYFPNVNELQDDHWIAHYSCDPLFHKGSLKDRKWDKFPDNSFYNLAKEWYSTYKV